MRRLVLVAILLLSPLSASSAASTAGFALVNAAGSDMTGLYIREVGRKDWALLSPGLSSRARIQPRFSSRECAFELRATFAGGGEAVWRDVNLCEVKQVTLVRRPDGMTFADYD